MNVKKMDVKTMEKSFFKFLIPSIVTTLLGGLYVIVDGFFVGNAVGDIGLAAIGLVYPIGTILISTALMIGVGGSVIMSIYLGEGNLEKSNEARANTFITLIVFSFIITIVLALLKDNILVWLGASGKLYDEANSYISIIIYGGSMQMISFGLMPIIRNSGKTIKAMVIMGSGLVINIILDAFFMLVLHMGIRGAALATVIAQASVAFLAIISVIMQRENKVCISQFKFDILMIRRLLFIGLSPFGLTLAPSLIVVFNNWQCLKYGGSVAVSAYAVINYITGSTMYFFEGVGEGLQPMISYFKGAREYKAMKRVFKKGVVIILFLSAVFLFVTLVWKKSISGVFGVSLDVANVIVFAIPIMAIAFPIQAIVRLGTSYFYASGESKYSTILTYIDPLFISPLCIIILPYYFNLLGVWLALPFAQFILVLLFIILLDRHRINVQNISNIEFENGK